MSAMNSKSYVEYLFEGRNYDLDKPVSRAQVRCLMLNLTNITSALR